MNVSPARLVSSLALLCATAAGPALADSPNQPLGFDPERAYQVSPQRIDQVDLYSGRLSAVLPIGPFSLFYNSNVWRYSADKVGNVVAQPDRQTSAGLGWHLGWGEVYEPNHWYNGSDNQWLFVGDDGGQHFFYSTLHYDDNNSVANVFYTRDGSYLRMKLAANRCSAEIEFPDGNTRRFSRSSCGPSSPLRWSSAWDRFGSVNDPDLAIAYNATDTQRTITDRHGRVHRVNLTDAYPWVIRTITSVDLESVGGQRAIYNFTYASIPVDRSCKDTSITTGNRITVPHLETISMPDGSEYSMRDGGNLQYHNSCNGIADVPGVLKGLVLPTGGKIAWEFQEYEFPPGGTNSVFNTSAGVKYRRLLDANRTEVGHWRYTTTSIGATAGTDPEVRTEVVVSPEGDCSRHYFNALYFIDPNPVPRGWETGLPFTYTESSGGRYLSSQVFSGNDGSGHCDNGTKLRSTYLRFRRDTLPGTPNDPSQWRNSNRQPDATRVVYHDDNDRYIDTEMSEFDGLGHFRRTVTTGSFSTLSSNAERRETYVGFNRSSGIYPGTYVPLAPSEPWVLGIFDHAQTTETEAEGETVVRVETDVDPATGAVLCERQLASGASQGPNDLITHYLRNNRGLITDTKRYGGDLDPVGVNQVALCGATVGTPVYWQHMTYANDTLRTVRPKQSNGTNGPFLTYDVDLDSSTDLVLTSRTPAGYATDYTYDPMGRITSVVPQDGASSHVTYTPAQGASPAEVSTVMQSFGGGSVLTQREAILDAFGRQHITRVLMPGGSWSEQEVTYNARDWVLSSSQPGSTSITTTYLDFDPFGRPGTIRPPEGALHDLTWSYVGDRTITREVKIATSLTGAESSFFATQEVDSHGRLRRVEEPSGAGGGATVTTYGYDASGRMTRIATGPQSQHQLRFYDYDNRGFMLSESHPELGTVTYQDYDAAGLAHRRTDGGRDLEYDFDFMGRPLTVRDKTHSDRLIKEFFYDVGFGFGMGRLSKSTRHNYVDMPWTPATNDNIRVSQVYSYAGVGGAISQQDTLFIWPDDFERFRQWNTYDDLGNVTQRQYPRLVKGPGDVTANTSRAVAFNHDQGLLTAVPGWVNSVLYHDSGLWRRTFHSNGVSHWQDRDPDQHGRPAQIYTTGSLPQNSDLATGSYAYDGAGNIASMGSDSFRYDGVSRLVEADVLGGFLNQTYTYDEFGNMTQRVTDGVAETMPINPANNRLTDGTYDGAGNLTLRQGKIWTYDAMNRVVGQAFMRYLYDASDERVASVPNVPQQRTVIYHLRDAAHRRTSQFTRENNVIRRDRDWVHGGGRLFASETPSGGRYHYFADHLGTPRLITDGNGQAVAHQDILPYGEEVLGTAGHDNVKLTGHERDESYDTDYMHARHYFSSISRFLSVDPLRGSAGDPQSLNRYAYVKGNPLRFSDPDGRQSFIEHMDVFASNVDVPDRVEIVRMVGGPGLGPFNPFRSWGSILPTIPTLGLGNGGSGGAVTQNEQPSDESEPETPAKGPDDEEKDDPCAFKFGGTGVLGGGVGLWRLHAIGTASFTGPNNKISLTSWGGAGVFTPGIHAQAGPKISQGVVSGKGKGIIVSIGAGKGVTFKYNKGDSGAWDLGILFGVASPHAGVFYGDTNTVVIKKGKRIEGVGCPHL